MQRARFVLRGCKFSSDTMLIPPSLPKATDKCSDNLYRSGVWEKQHSGDDERKRLLTQTRDLVTKGLQSDHEWHTVSHADYARPMLQVSTSLPYALLLLILV